MIESYVKTENGREAIKAYTKDEAPYPIVTFKPLQRNHKIVKYCTRYICLDTETSHTDNMTAWVYQWAMKFNKLYLYGRKPSEIIDTLSTIAEYYELSATKKIIILIHNASYDLQYLKNFLYEYDPTASFMALDAHAILICDVIGFRIICSYKLTNLSLAALSDNYAPKYRKAVGEIDYNIVRFQDTPLTDSDWFYMFSDVAAQDDGVKGYLEMQGYQYLFEAPFTSTGFVRTNCRKASKKVSDWRFQFELSKLSYEQYMLSRQAFMGGVCISSFKYAGRTVRGDNLGHDDFCSSYPARQKLDYFPTGAPSWWGEVESEEQLDYLLNTYCCIFMLTLEDVHIKKGVTAPCIPSSKCIELKDELKLNGKVIEASTLTIAVCELDYKWISRQYNYESMQVDKMLIFERGTIPDWLKDEVMYYFENKCNLKDVDGMELLYNKSKNMLNGIYGMTATSIIRDEYKMNDEHVLKKQKFEDKEAERQAGETRIKKYYNSYNSFLPYQYAIYTTAHARDALYTLIEATGDGDGKKDPDGKDDLTEVYCNFLYCDTDSAFYIKTDKNKPRLEAYRRECIEKAKAGGGFVGKKYLGAPEAEAPIRAFRGLHSKCYAMEEWDKKTGQYELKVVIAGIPKKATKWIDGKPVEKTNAEELGTIDALEDGFTFKHCGGTRCVYFERPIETIKIRGHEIELSSSAVIENIEKEISDTMYTADKDYNILNIQQESL